jgi:hypothetical protein
VQWANFRMYQVGAPLLHLPRLSRRPLMVHRVMVANELIASETQTVRAALIACAKDCANESDRAGGALEWEISVNDRSAVCALYPDFSPVRTHRGRCVLRWT